jgi:Fic family protein
MDQRSGTYIRQLSGYSAFVPNALPPRPPVALDGELQPLLSQADRALGRLDGSIQTLPNPDLFVFMYIRKEAVLSSQIEGTQSSLHDLLAAEAKLNAPGRQGDVGEVVNYVDAMNHGLARLGDVPLSVRLLLEIHAKLLVGVRGSERSPGEFRRTQNWIGPAGSTIANASFVPPPPHEVARCMGELEKFWHQNDDIPLLVKIGLAHAQLETIHPFLDGNGRAGRLLITFMLCSNEALQKPVLYLSHYFMQNRAEYYERLQAVRDNGAYEEWIAFFLRGVASVSQEATETARKILALREAHRDAIVEHLGQTAGNGVKLLEHLFRQPIVSVTEVERLLGVSYVAANTLVARVVGLGILQEITGNSRNRRFRYEPYVQLFEG